MVAFECDTCVFRKLHKREPDDRKVTDEVALACIRRVILDAFWSREASTVTGNLAKINQGLKLSGRLGLPGPYLPPGPLPSYDHCGHEVAMQMVLASTSPGRCSDDHTQWDTTRKLRTAYSNQIRSAREADETALALADLEGKQHLGICRDPCASLWFQRFMTGCKRQMGQDWRPDRAISVDLMAHLLPRVEDKAEQTRNRAERNRWIMAGLHFAASHTLSLRGPEGLLMDLETMKRHFPQHEHYVIVALLRRVKGEHHERTHLLPSVNVTDSGIRTRTWIRRALASHQGEGCNTGPAVCDDMGKALPTKTLNHMFHEVLCELHEDHPALFHADIASNADTHDKCDVSRSFRRGSDSRAMAKKVSELDIDVVNRWSKKERAGHNRPALSMKQHCVDITPLLDPFKRHTQAM